MKYRVIVDGQAMEDIERNAGWWADNHSLDEAIRWYDGILDAIYRLDLFPESNGLSAENSAFPYEIRDLCFGVGSRPTHRAVFTIVDDAVHVLTVQRAAQDAIHPHDVGFDSGT